LHVQGRCAGFLRTSEPARVQIAGFLCTAQDQPVVRATIACALDNFTLLTAGGDAKLAGLFARAEVNRKFCGRRDQLLAATPKRRMATAHKPIVTLRGQIAGN
ncbi:MAG: hypothetical protein AB7K04_00645, partial [Pseudorhodoplanes sp.]